MNPPRLGSWSAGSRARLPSALLVALPVALYPALLPTAALPPEAAMVAAGGLLALIFVRGLVSHDIRGGAALLWLQKPGRPERVYTFRLFQAGLWALVLHLVLVAGTVSLGVGPTDPTVGEWVSYLLLDAAVLGVGFTVSAAGLPLESVVALVLILGPGLLGADAQVVPEPWGGWAPWLAAQRFPMLEIHAVQGWIDGAGPRPEALTLLRPLLYPVVWAGLGLGWIRLTLHRRVARTSSG